MTLEEHIKTAKWLVKARKDLMAMYCLWEKRIKVISKAEQLPMMNILDLIDHLKFTLGKVYLRTVDNKTLEKLGDIYYKVD